MKCFLCKKCFKENDHYFKHLKSYHLLKYSDTYRCCGTIYKNASGFKRHVRAKHSSKQTATNVLKYDAVNLEATVSNSISPNKIVESETVSCVSPVVPTDSLSIITENFLKFQTAIYSSHNVCRSDVEKINNMLINLIIEPILQSFRSLCEKNEHSFYLEICNFTDRCQHIFKSLKSEHLISKKLMEEELFEDLVEEVVSTKADFTHKKGKLQFSHIEKKIAYMPLKFIFKKVLEKDNNLLKMISIMSNNTNRDGLTNISQGNLWNRKCEMYPNRLLIPYMVYSDDLEINNPLGSHSSNLVCNFYATFPCLPDDTKLENVFFIAAINSNDLKNIGKKRCLKPIIDQMKSLETDGISVKLSSGENYHPYFIPILILGDNLGLNSLLGFTKSFNSTFCRFCSIKKKESQTSVSIQPNLHRTYDNYEKHLTEKNPSETGIVEKCIFNSIPSFHVIDNYSVDAMHDVLEGICHYDICNALLYFIEEKKYFTIQLLNKRKQLFDYGELEIGNLCQEISLNHIKKKHLRMSAREMLTFIMYFPLMVGDFVPVDDEVWELILTLIEIIDTILLFEISPFNINAFKYNVEKHNRMYLNLFNDTLKPKFHILLHYPEVMQECGPVRKFWSFHFEAKHRGFKLYTHSITSRRNISVSLAKKYQFYFANYLLKTCSEKQIIYFERDRSESGFINIVSNILQTSLDQLDLYDKIIYNDTLYKKNFYIAIRNCDYTFYKVCNIVITQKKVYLFVQKIRTATYLKHYTAFQIDPSDLGDFEVFNIEQIKIPPTTIIGTAKGKFMIRLKEI